MSEAEFILNKWADRQNWDLDSQKALLLSFIDETGPEAVRLLDRRLAAVAQHENDMTDASDRLEALTPEQSQAFDKWLSKRGFGYLVVDQDEKGRPLFDIDEGNPAYELREFLRTPSWAEREADRDGPEMAR